MKVMFLILLAMILAEPALNANPFTGHVSRFETQRLLRQQTGYGSRAAARMNASGYGMPPARPSFGRYPSPPAGSYTAPPVRNFPVHPGMDSDGYTRYSRPRHIAPPPDAIARYQQELREAPNKNHFFGYGPVPAELQRQNGSYTPGNQMYDKRQTTESVPGPRPYQRPTTVETPSNYTIPYSIPMN